MATKKASKSKSSSLLASAPPESKAFVPSIPVDVLLLEATQVAKAGKTIRAKVAKLPSFDVAHLDGLPALTAGLKDAETTWGNLRFAIAAGKNKVAPPCSSPRQ